MLDDKKRVLSYYYLFCERHKPSGHFSLTYLHYLIAGRIHSPDLGEMSFL